MQTGNRLQTTILMFSRILPIMIINGASMKEKQSQSLAVEAVSESVRSAMIFYIGKSFLLGQQTAYSKRCWHSPTNMDCIIFNFQMLLSTAMLKNLDRCVKNLQTTTTAINNNYLGTVNLFSDQGNNLLKVIGTTLKHKEYHLCQWGLNLWMRTSDMIWAKNWTKKI